MIMTRSLVGRRDPIQAHLSRWNGRSMYGITIWACGISSSSVMSDRPCCLWVIPGLGRRCRGQRTLHRYLEKPHRQLHERECRGFRVWHGSAISLASALVAEDRACGGGADILHLQRPLDNATNVRYGGNRKPYFATDTDGTLVLRGQPVPKSRQLYIRENWLVRHSWLVRLFASAYVEIRHRQLGGPNPREGVGGKIQYFVASRGAGLFFGPPPDKKKIFW